MTLLFGGKTECTWRIDEVHVVQKAKRKTVIIIDLITNQRDSLLIVSHNTVVVPIAEKIYLNQIQNNTKTCYISKEKI